MGIVIPHPNVRALEQLLMRARGFSRAYQLTKDKKRLFVLVGPDDSEVARLINDGWKVEEELDLLKKERNEGS